MKKKSYLDKMIEEMDLNRAIIDDFVNGEVPFSNLSEETISVCIKSCLISISSLAFKLIS